MIKFKYTLNNSLAELARGTLSNYFGNSIIGYMDEGDVNNLRHMSLYLMCEIIVDETTGNKTYQNAIGVVARNDYQAVGMYNEINNTDTGSVLCEIENKCDELKVEPL